MNKIRVLNFNQLPEVILMDIEMTIMNGIDATQKVLQYLRDEDPYGFKAFDSNTGKEYWELNAETMPGILNPKFSILNYYDGLKNRLYFSDEENIYALKLGKDGGNFDWIFNYDDNGFDEMEFEDSYSVNTKWIGDSGINMNTTGTARRWSMPIYWGRIDDEIYLGFASDWAGWIVLNTLAGDSNTPNFTENENFC